MVSVTAIFLPSQPPWFGSSEFDLKILASRFRKRLCVCLDSTQNNLYIFDWLDFFPLKSGNPVIGSSCLGSNMLRFCPQQQ